MIPGTFISVIECLFGECIFTNKSDILLWYVDTVSFVQIPADLCFFFGNNYEAKNT